MTGYGYYMCSRAVGSSVIITLYISHRLCLCLYTVYHTHPIISCPKNDQLSNIHWPSKGQQLKSWGLKRLLLFSTYRQAICYMYTVLNNIFNHYQMEPQDPIRGTFVIFYRHDQQSSPSISPLHYATDE
jgi:hypothetical protein